MRCAVLRFGSLGLLSLLGMAIPVLAQLPPNLRYDGRPVLARVRFPAVAEPLAAAPLVFRGVTVIDVQRGQRRTAQTVVIVGARIQAVGPAGTVRVPRGAQVVDARDKYLIPGLWDMHFHISPDTAHVYPVLIANGVTGIRIPGGSPIPLEILLQWRREVAAGTRVGPRSLATGRMLENPPDRSQSSTDRRPGASYVAHTVAEAQSVVDSIKALGADFVKVHGIDERDVYFAVLAEGRRVGIPVLGHLPPTVTVLESSDSGLRTIEHLGWMMVFGHLRGSCDGDSATVETCAALATHLRRNNTWLVPTLTIHYYGDGYDPHGSQLPERPIYSYLPYIPDSLRRLVGPKSAGRDSTFGRVVKLMGRAGMPLLAGTDAGYPMRHLIHEELATLVEMGLTPLQALQAATLNPAVYLHATDSLGTVARGKLADLVLLDANPLADIHNTTTIRAVVANGHYFDRAALDTMLADAKRAFPAK